MSAKPPKDRLWVKILFWICDRFKISCYVGINTPDVKWGINMYKVQDKKEENHHEH